MKVDLKDHLVKEERGCFRTCDADGNETGRFDSFEEMLEDHKSKQSLWYKFTLRIWYWPVARFRDFKFKWKTKFYRFHRGYAPCDVWDMNIWFIDHAIPILKDMKKLGNSYPPQLSRIEEWHEVIDEILEGFTIAQQVMNHDAIFKKNYNNANPRLQKVYREQKIKLVSQAKYDRAFKLFHEYFFNLWD